MYPAPSASAVAFAQSCLRLHVDRYDTELFSTGFCFAAFVRARAPDNEAFGRTTSNHAHEDELGFARVTLCAGIRVVAEVVASQPADTRAA